MLRFPIIACTLAMLVPALAQTRGGGAFRSGFHSGPGFAGQYSHGYGRTNLVWFGDPFSYSDYAQPPIYAVPSSPSLVIVQPNSPAPAPEPKAEPLMIEWQGDKYVRFAGQRESANASSLDYAAEPSPALRSQDHAIPQTSQLPPAILIFRDGHHENVSDYVIANGNLYARGDYWRDGFWTKTVQLSSLDMPATLRANSETGVKFVLPSGPNEVVTRP
jgi:hypothetical protein